MLKTIRQAAAVLLFAMVSLPLATAQTPKLPESLVKAATAAAAAAKPPTLEVIMSSSGKLIAPWAETRACNGQPRKCVTVVYNPQTKEIASADGVWATRFESSGDGLEVRRAETTMAKALRFKSAPLSAKPTSSSLASPNVSTLAGISAPGQP